MDTVEPIMSVKATGMGEIPQEAVVFLEKSETGLETFLQSQSGLLFIQQIQQYIRSEISSQERSPSEIVNTLNSMNQHYMMENGKLTERVLSLEKELMALKLYTSSLTMTLKNATDPGRIVQEEETRRAFRLRAAALPEVQQSVVIDSSNNATAGNRERPDQDEESVQNDFQNVTKKPKRTASPPVTYAKITAGEKVATAVHTGNYYASIDPTMPAAVTAGAHQNRTYVGVSPKPRQQSSSQGQRPASASRQQQSAPRVPPQRQPNNTPQQASRQQPSLRQQIQQAASEAERAALLWRTTTEVVTAEIGTVSAAFPLSKTALAHPMTGLRLAVKDASGVDPLAVSLLSRNSCVIYFDTALISVQMMGEMLQRKKCTLLDPRPMTDADIDRVAHTYVRSGFFKRLRHAMLPLHDASLMERVLLRARDVVKSMPKEDRRRLLRTIEVDSAELLMDAVLRGQSHEEEKAESVLPANGKMEAEDLADR